MDRGELVVSPEARIVLVYWLDNGNTDDRAAYTEAWCTLNSRGFNWRISSPRGHDSYEQIAKWIYDNDP